MKIFVYGTLKWHERNNQLLKILDAIFIRKAETKPEYLMIINEKTKTPYALKDGNTSIKGEIYELPDKFEEFLDNFERNYTREEIELADGEKIWCYLAPFKILPSGNFET